VSLPRQQVRQANKGHLPGVGADSGDGQGQEGGQGTGEGVRWRCCHWCGSGSSGTPWCARCLRVHGNVQAGVDVPLLGSGDGMHNSVQGPPATQVRLRKHGQRWQRWQRWWWWWWQRWWWW
jgi:hypothetical protein